jgi:hypothetical protein
VPHTVLRAAIFRHRRAEVTPVVEGRVCVFSYVWQRGILVVERRVPESTFQESKLCLAPSGEGWGVRLSRSVQGGCVPLIGQPMLEQPLETLLDYDAFSLRMGHGDAADLPTRLGDTALPPTTLHAMRRALAPARRALEWRASHGGLAYNLTVLALCHRAVQLRGKLHAPDASCEPLAHAVLPLVGLSPRAVRERAAHGVTPAWYPRALVNVTEHLQKQRRAALRAHIALRRSGVRTGGAARSSS